MVVASPVRIDRGRIEELAAKEQKRLDASTRKSGEMYEWARRTLAGGVASSYQVRDPWPIYITEGRGSKVWDVDGT
jgi:glutamate-1-semialdehyde 2,1-aminomutase